MKKLLLILLSTLLLLSACSSSTTDRTSPQAEAAAVETVVYEDSSVKATFRGVSTVAGQIGMTFTLENKSSHEITVLPMNSSVNDVMVQFVSGTPATIQPGKKANQVWMANPDVVGVKADGVTSIELSFNYDDVTTETIKIEV